MPSGNVLEADRPVEIGRAIREGVFMSGPIFVPRKAGIDQPRFQRLVDFWLNLLANPELVERSVFFNSAAYEGIRIPKLRRRLLFGKKNLIDWSDHANWERETKDYLVVILVGGRRITGMEMSFIEPVLTLALGGRTSRR